MNGQCGLTFLRKCHSHNTQEWILAAEMIENRFWQNKRLIFRAYLNNERMVIVLMTNSVLYETFDDHQILIFLCIKIVFFYFGQNVLFTVSATNNRVHRSTWVSPLLKWGTVPCAASSLRQREQCNKYFDKIVRFSCSNHNVVPSSTKFVIKRAIPGPITWKCTTSAFFTLRVDKGYIFTLNVKKNSFYIKGNFFTLRVMKI